MNKPKARLLGIMIICISIAVASLYWFTPGQGFYFFLFPLPFIPYFILIGLSLTIGGFYMLVTGKEIGNDE